MSDDQDNVYECIECIELAELLSEYLDGEATPEMRAALMEHVQSCDHCARLVWKLRELVGRCRCEAPAEVPIEVHRQLWQVIVREIRVERQSPEA
jgi:anti-sigma factor RsiW